MLQAVRHDAPVSLVKKLLDHGLETEVDRVSDSWELSPLRCAVEQNVNPELLKLLLDRGADVNKQDMVSVIKHDTHIYLEELIP